MCKDIIKAIMKITNIPTKVKPEIFTLDISIDYSKTKTIYELKSIISKNLNIEFDSIFLYNADEDIERRKIYQNTDEIDKIQEILYKILKNSCNVCGSKATLITGDCNYCKCKYCNIHRLPESHKCACMNDIKKGSYNDNLNRVMNGKCVATMV